MSARWKVLGVNDEDDTCECCGRTGLKRVVWMENGIVGIRHFGIVCAGHKLGISGTKAVIENKLAELAQDALRAERERIFTEECRLWRNVYILKETDLKAIFLSLGYADAKNVNLDVVAMAAVNIRREKYPVTR